jgi:O-antigen/teichoic acid export membrane protein
MNDVDRTRGVLGGTLVLMLAQVSSIVVSLLLTPFMVNELGLERFGLWAFLNAVVAFAGLLEVGLGRGSVRFIAVFGERKELDVVRRIVSYGMLSRIALGVLLCPLAWLLGRGLLPHAGISDSLLGEAKTLLPLVLGYFFLSAGVRLLSALLIGFERTWLVALITLVSQLVYAALVVVFLLAGLELYGLLIAAGIQSILQGVACYAFAKRLIGQVFGNPFALRRELIVEMLKFGGWTQVTALSALVNRQTDAIVIGSFLSVRSVGLYDIGNRIAQLTRTLPLTLLGPLLPATARMHAQRDDKRIARTLLQGNRLLALMSLGIAGFIVATAPLIMTVWLGRRYPDVATIAVLLTLTWVVNNLTGVGTTVVAAIGRPAYESEYALIGMVLNIAATIVLGTLYGLYGVIVGTVFGVVTSSIYFLWRVHRLLGLPLWQYLGSWLWRLCASTAIAAAVTLAVRTALPDSIVDDRANGGLALVLLALLYAGAMLVNLRLFRFLESRDLDTVERVLPTRLRRIARTGPVEFLFGARP